MKQSGLPQRQSNIELLRIFAMIMVVTVHTGFIVNLMSVKARLDTEPVAAVYMSFVQCASIICVDLFVLVSGYFGIHTSIRRLLKFMYMCVFWGFGIAAAMWVVSRVFDKGPAVHLGTLINMLVPGNGYWFAKSYILLMIVAPALNLLFRKASSRTLLTIAVGFYLFQFIGDRLSDVYEDIWHGGFSPYSFIGLYMIGASVSRFKDKITLSSGTSLGIYLAFTIIATILVIRELPSLSWFYAWSIRYNSLIVILSSLFFFIAFTRFKFTSRTVNFFAASAFAVYLLHEHPLIQPYYRQMFQYLWDNYPWWYYPFFQVSGVVAIYLVATLIDQIRIWSWRLIDSRVDFERLLHRRIEPAILKVAARIFSLIFI